jgi:hypothetical protein
MMIDSTTQTPASSPAGVGSVSGNADVPLPDVWAAASS